MIGPKNTRHLRDGNLPVLILAGVKCQVEDDGRHVEATESYRRALALVSNEAERRHLEKRLREIAS